MEFEYLHRKSRWEMLIGGNVFQCLYTHSRSFLLRADWRKSDSSFEGEPRGNWRRHSNSRVAVASSPAAFSARQQERPGELARRVVLHKYKTLNTHSRRNHQAKPKGHIAIKLYKVAKAHPTTRTKNSSQRSMLR